MSLGDAYTLGVEVTGDIQSLRAELQSGTQLIANFANQSVASMARAAAAMESSAQAMQSSASRTTRSQQDQASQTRQAAQQIVQAQQNMALRWQQSQREMATSTEQTTATARSSYSTLGSTLARLTGGAGIALLAKQVWDVGFGFNTFTQNTQVALTTLLGSQAAAKSFLSDILAFAKTTPYAFTDLTDQAQKLITYGFQAKDVIPILRSVGDASTAMGKGQDGVSRLVLALGQINSKGRLQSQELLQLSEIGVNGLKILANQAGVTTAEYSKLVEKGLIPADQAINGLVKGINEGTNGINGTTTAFGGMMAQIKGSGGITATLDSTRTAFRNAAGAVTENLVPALLGFLHVAQDGLGVVQQVAKGFGGLPAPVQAAALAMVAAGAASHFLGPRLQESATGFISATREAYRYQTALAAGAGVTSRTSVLVATASSGLKTGASALLGALGGPWGLAITGASMAVAAFAGAQEQAKAAIQEVSTTLDAQSGAITDNTRKWVQNQLTTAQGWGPLNKGSALAAAKKLGLDLGVVQDAALGSADALAKLNAILPNTDSAWTAQSPNADALNEAAKKAGMSLGDYRTAVEAVKDGVKGTSKTIGEAQKIAELKAEADKKSTVTLDLQTGAIKANAGAWVQWSDDQQKAITQAAQAAAKASDASFTTVQLDIATQDDVAAARDKVTEATKSLRNAEVDREETYKKRKVSTNDKVKAEEAVKDARKALDEATKNLADTEGRTDPTKEYRKKVQSILDSTKTFVADIQTLASKGLNATDLASLIQAGPQASADTRKALLGDPGAIDFTNEARKTIDALTTSISSAMTVTQSGIESGDIFGKNLGLGIQIAMQDGAAETVQQIADALGQDPARIYAVGQKYGLTFLQGLKDAWAYDATQSGGVRIANGKGSGGLTAYATGGIYPGYTPGRDIGVIAVSGGEAIMRPEWTRAVGSGFVDRMNAIARTMGVGGVRAEMARYLGGFANGGIAPQVVTVPVHSTNERYSPVTVQKAYVVSAESLGVYGDRTRAQRNIFGGTRG